MVYNICNKCTTFIKSAKYRKRYDAKLQSRTSGSPETVVSCHRLCIARDFYPYALHAATKIIYNFQGVYKK